MVSCLYNLFLFIFGLFSLPKLLWKKKNSWKMLKAKLGLELPILSKERTTLKPVFWIHAVSLGETRAAIPLVRLIKQKFPKSCLVVSSTTETGFDEAKKSLAEADSRFFLPLDFSSVMRKLVSMVKPDVLILMEGEFWYHLLQEAKTQGAAILLANGKLSEISRERFALFSFFTKRLFSLIDHFCLQSSCHEERFLELGISKEKMTVTGNLKFDTPVQRLTASEKEYWKMELGIGPDDRLLTIGSTHASEEKRLLTALLPLFQEIPHLKVLLVPRHPERFLEVKALLERSEMPFLVYSKREEKNFRERVVLMDEMGLLRTCYQLSELALVGGSFIRGIGGHNVFEPIQCGIPVLFGPHMEAQRDFTHLLLQAQAARQLSLEELPRALLELFQNGQLRARMTASGDKLIKCSKGALQRTWEQVLERV
ncbi:MAG: hypothetical protein A2Y28_04560 [Chlamydiae bacterium GWC2_50_10]|nr:MAG: hypothetical protein A2098_00405 [Chlamydiae bacterium GWF2_49_8]OGN54923.1 MAG: hypothetical protein A2Y28_04560 [Chlamydiae bacterium GWC2_50_10]OGN57230.1 MAG: hypothetical protein A3D18_00155 [Chlamydiae bacterium RIFCSPHIGHO2_02_FULL_49_29]OGN70044.1 MAG: hypothetical protein A3I15_02025 [Chlamydiae bacterium RIFCSPLOWO2_02_FULL_49_12]HCJ83892.1 3-deoxy-D-manno-octulosonic acid transferase [Parachlamydiales bacterium]